MNCRQQSAARRGFTLVELVVVVAILAVLAGLIVPKLGFMQERAADAATAATSASLVSNLETYRTSTGSYPLGLDTLLTGGTTVYANLWGHSYGPGVNIGPKYMFTPDTVTSTYAESFGHSFVPNSSGNYFFYDHSEATTVTDLSDSAVTQRMAQTISAQTFAFVDTSTSNIATPALIQSLGYPNGLPTGVRLVAFGVGPNSNLNETIASPPRAPGQTTNYGRYIAIFALYANGKSAQLKGVIDPLGDSIDDNNAAYAKAAPAVN